MIRVRPSSTWFKLSRGAERLTRGLSEAVLASEETVQWAVFSQIVILGETAGRVDKVFQADHADVPWASIIGMRHRLVHGYDSVDWHRVRRTLSDDLPTLHSRLSALLA
jgi:uncharacterized protein with HEPN domain